MSLFYFSDEKAILAPKVLNFGLLLYPFQSKYMPWLTLFIFIVNFRRHQRSLLCSITLCYFYNIVKPVCLPQHLQHFPALLSSRYLTTKLLL